jgi:hypothetical protein
MIATTTQNNITAMVLANVRFMRILPGGLERAPGIGGKVGGTVLEETAVEDMAHSLELLGKQTAPHQHAGAFYLQSMNAK